LHEILSKTVRDQRIDYVAVRDLHGTQLENYLVAMAAVDVAALPEPERLAFWFNLYNANMIAAVVGRLRQGWSPAAGNYGVFKEKLVRAAGKTLSLDDVEHEILRKTFKEPRLHVALVCGARSCPPLLPRAYRAEDLDAVLEQNMHAFINDPARNKVDANAKKLELSRIFDWFKVDFGGDQGVKALVGKHTGTNVSGFAISYLEYDWTLNLAAPTQGEFVHATVASTLSSAPATDDVLAEVKAGDILQAWSDKDGMTEVTVPKGQGKRGYIGSVNVKKLGT
jgi:hypothetical protein